MTAPVRQVWTRRQVVQAGGLAVAVAQPVASLARATATPDDPAALPVSGEAVPELAVFDDLLRETLAAFAIPGGQSHIAREGRLVFDRGYGYGDLEAGTPVAPEALFRIASTSAPRGARRCFRMAGSRPLRLSEAFAPRRTFAGVSITMTPRQGGRASVPAGTEARPGSGRARGGVDVRSPAPR